MKSKTKNEMKDISRTALSEQELNNISGGKAYDVLKKTGNVIKKITGFFKYFSI